MKRGKKKKERKFFLKHDDAGWFTRCVANQEEECGENRLPFTFTEGGVSQN